MPKTEKAKVMPQFTPAPQEMKDLFGEALAAFPQAQQRKMFGYPAAFVNGNLAAGLFQQDMFLRLSDDDRAAFRGEYKARLFEPMPGRPMRGYVLVPRFVLNSTRLMRMWLGKALDYTATLPPKAQRQRAKK